MNLAKSMPLQARYLKPVITMSKVRGRPFKISEISQKIDECGLAREKFDYWKKSNF